MTRIKHRRSRIVSRRQRGRVHARATARGEWVMLPGDTFGDWVGPLVGGLGYVWHGGSGIDDNNGG